MISSAYAQSSSSGNASDTLLALLPLLVLLIGIVWLLIVAFRAMGKTRSVVLQTTASKPRQLVAAVRIMWLMLAVLVLSVLIQSDLSIFQLLILALTLVLVAYVIRAVSAARNWARITYAVIASLAILRAVGGIGSLSSAMNIILQLIVIAAYTTVIVLLFHPASNAWFKGGGHAAR